MTPEQIIHKLEANFVPDPNSGCWLWTAGLFKTGYGSIHIGTKTKRAHRVMYELVKGPVPDGKPLDHLCRVRSCINPNHLEPVTHQENARRGIGGETTRRRMKAKTHCPKGHPYEGYNIIWINNGIVKNGRGCRICAVARTRAWRKRLRASKLKE